MLALIDGFDKYSNFAAQCHRSWAYVPGTSTMVPGRNGGYGIKLSQYADFRVIIPAQAYVLCDLDIPVPQWVAFGAAVKLDNFDHYWIGSKPIFSIKSADPTADMGSICVNQNGQLFGQRIVNNTLGVHGGSSDQIIAGRWYYIEVYFYTPDLCTPRNCTIKIYIDSVLSSTINMATWDVHWFYDHYDLVYIRLEGNNNTIAFDDFYAADGGFYGGIEDVMGEQKILAASPTADDGVQGLTPSSGSDNYAMVDDDPGHDSDATYNHTMEKYLTDRFTKEGLILPHHKVNAVQVSVVAKKGVNQGRRVMVPFLNSSGVEVVPFPPSPYLSESAEITESYGRAHTVYEKDPNGDIDWTVAAMNDAKIGYGV